MRVDNMEQHFLYWHNNPPRPLNPDFDPKARTRSATVTNSMETDNFYATHTREECKIEWRRRYDALKAQGK